jgi:vacuolar-type H+-ATPase subunit F/Vma7
MVFLHIDKSNFNKFPNTNKNVIVKLEQLLHNNRVFALIYMEGCGPCNAVRPEWTKLQNVLKNFQDRKDVAIVDIEKDLLENVKYLKHKPNSFPTIRYITNKGETIENYEDSDIKNKDRTIDSFVEWIKSKENKENNNHKKTNKKTKQTGGKTRRKIGGKWSAKYKRSINCRSPKGFSQRQHCKYGRKK